MSIRKRYLLDTFGTMLTQVAISLKGLLIIPLVTKHAGTAVFGTYSLVISAVTILIGVSSLGTFVRYRRYLPSAGDDSQRAVLFYPQFIFQLCVALLVACALLLVAASTRSLKGEFSGWLAGVYVALYVFFAQLPNYFRYTNRVRLFNLSTTLVPYLFLGVVAVAIWLGFQISVNVLLALESAAMALVVVWLGTKVIRELGARVRVYSYKDLKVDIRLGFPMVLALVIDFVLASSDRFLIGSFVSVSAVGQYVPAFALGSLIMIVAKIAGVVLPPILSELVDSHNEKEARDLVNFSVSAFLVIAIPFVVGASLLSADLLIVIANAEVAAKASLVTPIVALASVFYGLCVMLDIVLFVRLKTAAMLKASTIAVFVSVGMNVLLLPLFGNILVAACAMFAAYVTMFIYVSFAVASHWQFKFDFTTLAKSGVAALIMGVLLFYTGRWLGEDAGIFWTAARIVGAVAVYGVSAFLLGVLSPADRAMLGEFVGRRVSRS